MLQSIGSDMELFAKNKAGEHVALCGLIGGTKMEPLQLEHLPKGFMIQEDNVAFEYNIPVCENKTQFVNAFATMRKEIKSILSTMKLDMSTNASVSFDKKELTHPNALVFGCEPDYSAWKLEENQKPHSNDETLRTAGGHIHVGTDIDMVQGVRLMDLYLGVPSVLIDDSPASIARRELYGKAGAMRPKPYGFEYRVLSNFWMFSDKLTGWVFNNTREAMQAAVTITDKMGERIQHCINTGDKDEAKAIIAEFNIALPA